MVIVLNICIRNVLSYQKPNWKVFLLGLIPISKMMFDSICETRMITKEKKAWISSKNVATKFLRDVKNPN